MPRRGRFDDIEPPPVRLVEPVISVEDLPPPPDHLSEQMKSWWRQVMADYVLDQHHLRLLEFACDSFDRMVQAREVLRKEGLTIDTRDGAKKRHPAADVERDSRTSFLRAVRELDLDADPPKETPGWRPPALRSNRRR